MTDTIHVIDDDADVVESLCSFLSVKGYSTQGHGSAEEFLRAFSASETLCIIVDLRMPGMSGLQLQSHLQQSAIDVPFIFVTGYGDVSTAVRALKSGAADFIEKPVDVGLLLESIKKAAETRRLARKKQEIESHAHQKLSGLTLRERDVLQQLIRGNPNKIIAYELGISTRTVENHRARLMDKLQAGSLAELVQLALAGGLLPTRRKD